VLIVVWLGLGNLEFMQQFCVDCSLVGTGEPGVHAAVLC